MKKIRNIKIVITTLLLLLLVSSCSEKPENSNPAQPASSSKPVEKTPTIKKPQTYIELGDLEAIKKRKKIRFIAPRFDGADALPRNGVPVQSYQQVAEAYAESLNLNIEWVFVDNFSQLIPTLRTGKGDVIITNMTITQPRQEKVSFTRPINLINEVLITDSSYTIDDLSQITGLNIGVPAGTAYVETLKKLSAKQQQLNYTILAANNSDSDMLNAVSDKKIQATIIDSDVADVLLLDYPSLTQSIAVKSNRKIAWAVRKDNSLLLTSLNEFLVSHHVQASANVSERRDWQAIQQYGKLRMLTTNNPASYFMWRGELMGFDFDIIKKFASKHDLHVSVIMKDSASELIEALKNGEGDLIAASMTQSSERESLGIQFSRPYVKINEVLVSQTEKAISTPEELNGKVVGVNPDSVYKTYFDGLLASGINFTLKEYPQITTEGLIDKLVAGEFDYTALDSHFFAIEQTHRENLVKNFSIGDTAHIAWGLREDQPALMEELNTYIKKSYRGLFYNVTFNKYFRNDRKIKKHNQARVVKGSALSPYDDLVKPLAKQYGMDWRLITAQMYQESKFNPKAKSFAGAQGLMQVMPRTAKEFGYSNLHIPENGIKAGITYMNWLEKRFPGELELQERIFFTLAAYNAGAGHVRDARKLARQLGKNPNKWFGHTEEAMLLLAKPEYHKKARFGYVRGSEPVEYVKKIRDRYLGYLQIQ